MLNSLITTEPRKNLVSVLESLNCRSVYFLVRYAEYLEAQIDPSFALEFQELLTEAEEIVAGDVFTDSEIVFSSTGSQRYLNFN